MTIAYLFDSLTFNPHIPRASRLFYSVHPSAWDSSWSNVRGGPSSCSMPIASSWKTAPRSWDLQHAGLKTPSHQHDLRNSCFWLSNHLSRVLIGSFDKLIFAFLLETHEDEGPASIHLQPGIVVLVFVTFGLIFGLLVFSMLGRFFVWMPCSWHVRSEWWKESPLLVAPNHPGLSLSRFWLLPSFVCQRPYHCADLLSSLILGHDRDLPCSLMLGSPSSCICLRKRRAIITNPTTWSRSLTSSIAWRKMQWAFATIAILSTMVLVTICCHQHLCRQRNGQENHGPHDFSSKEEGADLEQLIRNLMNLRLNIILRSRIVTWWPMPTLGLNHKGHGFHRLSSWWTQGHS